MLYNSAMLMFFVRMFGRVYKRFGRVYKRRGWLIVGLFEKKKVKGILLTV
jgi:hypothetical protein